MKLNKGGTRKPRASQRHIFFRSFNYQNFSKDKYSLWKRRYRTKSLRSLLHWEYLSKFMTILLQDHLNAVCHWREKWNAYMNHIARGYVQWKWNTKKINIICIGRHRSMSQTTGIQASWLFLPHCDTSRKDGVNGVDENSKTCTNKCQQCVLQ